MQNWKDEQEYIDSVLTQVRWKAAHNLIRKELANHISDQKEAFLGEENSANNVGQMAIAKN